MQRGNHIVVITDCPDFLFCNEYLEKLLKISQSGKVTIYKLYDPKTENSDQSEIKKIIDNCNKWSFQYGEYPELEIHLTEYYPDLNSIHSDITIDDLFDEIKI